jgi:hypothetical protein
MSPFFVKIFKKESGKCPKCKDPKRKEYSLCQEHLDAARTYWQSWSTTRRLEGKCSYCKLKSYKGMLRCKKHREITLARTRAWHAAHPDYSAQQWEKRKEQIKEGFCPSCAEHRPLDAGFTRCATCRARAKYRVTGKGHKPKTVGSPYSRNW